MSDPAPVPVGVPTRTSRPSSSAQSQPQRKRPRPFNLHHASASSSPVSAAVTATSSSSPKPSLPLGRAVAVAQTQPIKPLFGKMGSSSTGPGAVTPKRARLEESSSEESDEDVSTDTDGDNGSGLQSLLGGEGKSSNKTKQKERKDVEQQAETEENDESKSGVESKKHKKKKRKIEKEQNISSSSNSKTIQGATNASKTDIRNAKSKSPQPTSAISPTASSLTQPTPSTTGQPDSSTLTKKQRKALRRALKKQTQEREKEESKEEKPIPIQSTPQPVVTSTPSPAVGLPSAAIPTLTPVNQSKQNTGLDIRSELRERAARMKLAEDQQRKEAEMAGKMTKLEQEIKNRDVEITTHKETLETVKQAFTCGICLNLMDRPYLISPCGHAACFQCLRSWFLTPAPASPPPQSNNLPFDQPPPKILSCPQCRTRVTAPPTPIYLLQHLIPVLAPVLVGPDETLGPSSTSADTSASLAKASEMDIDGAGGWGALFEGALAGEGWGLPIWDSSDGCWRCKGCASEVLDGVCTNCARQYLNPEADRSSDRSVDGDSVGSMDSLDLPEVQADGRQRRSRRNRREDDGDEEEGHDSDDEDGTDLDAYETESGDEEEFDEEDGEGGLDRHEAEVDQRLKELGATSSMIERFSLTIDGKFISALVPDSRHPGEPHEIRFRIRDIDLEEDDTDGSRFIRQCLREHPKQARWWHRERITRNINRSIDRRGRALQTLADDAAPDDQNDAEEEERPLSDDSEDSSLDGEGDEGEEDEEEEVDLDNRRNRSGPFIDSEADEDSDEESGSEEEDGEEEEEEEEEEEGNEDDDREDIHRPQSREDGKRQRRVPKQTRPRRAAPSEDEEEDEDESAVEPDDDGDDQDDVEDEEVDEGDEEDSEVETETKPVGRRLIRKIRIVESDEEED